MNLWQEEYERKLYESLKYIMHISVCIILNHTF